MPKVVRGPRSSPKLEGKGRSINEEFPEERKVNLSQNKYHLGECSDRWTLWLNRDKSSSDYNPEWRNQRCAECRFHIRLACAFKPSWGACTNPDSEFDACVMHEFDGCDGFVSDKLVENTKKNTNRRRSH